ncbi:MAG TPA: HisA/HisF-related TIM barrel protein [Gemmatimonadales bacterium]|nr:HisA/HisF-related TIM barrel protein [Gemmatimonadales bacterium]
MDIIPVLDVTKGIAVHARGGDREAYEPVRSVLLADDCVGDPWALARAYHDSLGAHACYLADLDAIRGGPVQRAVIRDVGAFQTGFHGELLVDAGVGAPDAALEVLSCGASAVVVGLETLRSFAALRAIVDAAGANRVVFSVDLRLGVPMLHPDLRATLGGVPGPAALIAHAVDGGVTTLLLLDVGRVGTGSGVDLDLVSAARRRHPGARLLAGGGVSTRQDLERMAAAGCDGALVATAIHAGVIGAEEVAAFRDRPGRTQSAPSVST